MQLAGTASFDELAAVWTGDEAPDDETLDTLVYWRSEEAASAVTADDSSTAMTAPVIEI